MKSKRLVGFVAVLAIAFSGCEFSAKGKGVLATGATAQNDVAPLPSPSPTVVVIEPPSVARILVKAKAYLRGVQTTAAAPYLMLDRLRAQGLLPEYQPYTANPRFFLHKGKEKTTRAILAVEGEKAVVDWVILELRLDTGQIVDSRAALLLRDSSIVDVDGASPVSFDAQPGQYRLTVRHRNHLSLSSLQLLNFQLSIPTVFDFTDLQAEVKGTKWIERLGYRMLIGGDANSDGTTQGSAEGGVNDRTVVNECTAVGGQGLYASRDLNLDGVCNAGDSVTVSVSLTGAGVGTNGTATEEP